MHQCWKLTCTNILPAGLAVNEPHISAWWCVLIMCSIHYPPVLLSAPLSGDPFNFPTHLGVHRGMWQTGFEAAEYGGVPFGYVFFRTLKDLTAWWVIYEYILIIYKFYLVSFLTWFLTISLKFSLLFISLFMHINIQPKSLIHGDILMMGEIKIQFLQCESFK